LAGSIAVLTGDEKHGGRRLKVLRILRNNDDDLPLPKKDDSQPSLPGSPWRYASTGDRT
jgi:hypothetical protein